MPMTDRDELSRTPRNASRDLHDHAIQESLAVLDEIIDDLRTTLRPAADDGRPDAPTK